jgi:hypothetical protein
MYSSNNNNINQNNNNDMNNNKKVIPTSMLGLISLMDMPGTPTAVPTTKPDSDIIVRKTTCHFLGI